MEEFINLASDYQKGDGMGTAKCIDALKQPGIVRLYLEKRRLAKTLRISAFSSAKELNDYVLQKHPQKEHEGDPLEKFILTDNIVSPRQLTRRLLEIYAKARKSEVIADFCKNVAVLDFALGCDFFDPSAELNLLPLLSRRLQIQIEQSEIDLSAVCSHINHYSDRFAAPAISGQEGAAPIHPTLVPLAILSLEKTHVALQSEERLYDDLPGLTEVAETRKRSEAFDAKFKSSKKEVANSVLQSRLESLTRLANLNPRDVFTNVDFFRSAELLAERTGDRNILLGFIGEIKQICALRAYSDLMQSLVQKMGALEKEGELFADPRILIVDIERLIKITLTAAEKLSEEELERLTPIMPPLAKIQESFVAHRTEFLNLQFQKCVFKEDYERLVNEWDDAIDPPLLQRIDFKKARAQGERILLEQYATNPSPMTLSRIIQRAKTLDLPSIKLKLNFMPHMRTCCEKSHYNIGDFELTNTETGAHLRMPLEILHNLEFHKETYKMLATEIERLTDLLGLNLP